jgi:hypothetical protein
MLVLLVTHSSKSMLSMVAPMWVSTLFRGLRAEDGFERSDNPA